MKWRNDNCNQADFNHRTSGIVSAVEDSTWIKYTPQVLNVAWLFSDRGIYPCTSMIFIGIKIIDWFLYCMKRRESLQGLYKACCTVSKYGQLRFGGYHRVNTGSQNNCILSCRTVYGTQSPLYDLRKPFLVTAGVPKNRNLTQKLEHRWLCGRTFQIRLTRTHCYTLLSVDMLRLFTAQIRISELVLKSPQRVCVRYRKIFSDPFFDWIPTRIVFRKRIKSSFKEHFGFWTAPTM